MLVYMWVLTSESQYVCGANLWDGLFCLLNFGLRLGMVAASCVNEVSESMADRLYTTGSYQCWCESA